MKNDKLRYGLLGVIVLILVIGLAACSQETSPTIPEMTEVPGSTDASTEEPETPVVETSISEATVILTSSSEADQGLVMSVSNALEALTQASGLKFETVENLTPESITTNVKVVVGIGEDLDIAGWALGSPNTQFIAVNMPGIDPSNNISVIGDPVLDENRTAFMAGYLAALISEDYKVSALIPSDIDTNEKIIDSFLVGARFFCGICQPKYPPYNQFPQWQTLPVENASSGFEGVVDLIASNGTEILFLHESLLSPEILDYLAGYGLVVISNGVQKYPYAYWAGTLETDLVTGLNTIWSNVVAGNGGFKVPGSLILTDMDAELISEGRYRLFEEMADDLENGMISIDPTP